MTMSFREMNMAVFRREPLPHVFFQPRFEPWVAWHRQFGSLPDEIRDLSLSEVYDHVDASMRSVHYYTGQSDPIQSSWTDEVVVSVEESENRRCTRFDTPHGPLFQVEHYTVDGTWRMVEFLGKSVEDLPRLRWLLQRRILRFDPETYRQGKAFVGDRGEGHFWVPKSPYFALAQQWFGYSDFIYALVDAPKEIEELMRIVDDSYDALYEQLCDCDDVRILNFGENVAEAYLSPAYYEQYVAPWYHKRSGQLRDAGVFTHIHIDGNFRSLLGYLKDMPFDGLEALTPKPQGDVTIEEIKEHIGDKILLDGIPAVLFLDHHSRDQLQECVEKLVKLFHPKLILGVSDELPEGGGDEAFERLKWVAQYARKAP
jgi:uroporphyrinogen decarboxylase-like protein